MSQAKVDRYKKEKANRKKTMRREKIGSILRRCAYTVVGLALVAWIGYSGYNTYTSNKTTEEVEIDYTAVSNYMQGLSAE